MFWLTAIIIYILILLIIIITIAFIILLITITILYCYYSHHYYCSQYYQCYLFYFISFYFLLFILLWLLFVCCVWRVCVPLFFSFPFSCIWFTFYTRIAYTCEESFFFSHYCLYHHCHHHNHFIFFNTTSHWGRIQQMNSSDMVYPYPLITLGKLKVSIIFIYFFFCKLFFGDHRWGVGALFHIYHLTSFNYDAKGARDGGLSCRCHLSNSQIVYCVQIC